MKKGFYFAFWQEWSEWFDIGSYNWNNFTFVNAQLEVFKYKGKGAELQLGLLGLNVKIIYRWDSWSESELQP